MDCFRMQFPPSFLGLVFIIVAFRAFDICVHHPTEARSSEAPSIGHKVGPPPHQMPQLRIPGNRLYSATAPSQTRGREIYKTICLSRGLPSGCRPPVPFPKNKWNVKGRGQRQGIARWARACCCLYLPGDPRVGPDLGL